MKKGDRAGSVGINGYRKILIDGVTYSEHRLAWLYMTGEWPEQHLDHINMIKNDNCFANLRKASYVENQGNIAGRNKTGFKGVSKTKSGKFTAYINDIGKNRSLGRYDTAELAAEAYMSAARDYFGDFARA